MTATSLDKMPNSIPALDLMDNWCELLQKIAFDLQLQIYVIRAFGFPFYNVKMQFIWLKLEPITKKVLRLYYKNIACKSLENCCFSISKPKKSLFIYKYSYYVIKYIDFVKSKLSLSYKRKSFLLELFITQSNIYIL